MMTQADVIRMLDLKLLPEEGGYFRETYRSHLTVDSVTLGIGTGTRNVSTAIYYFLTPDQYSALHRIKYDEIFHFYLGDPVEMVQLTPEGQVQKVTLGQDILHGESVQVVVPPNTWQGLRIKDGGNWALLGTTVAPGFDFLDFELGNFKELSEQYPQHIESLRRFSR